MPVADVVPAGTPPKQSNSSVIVDAAVLLKLYRRLAGRRSESKWAASSPTWSASPTRRRCSAAIELVEGDERTTVAVPHAFVENQGDDWTHTSAYLDRLLEEARLLPGTPDKPDDAARHAAYLNRIRQIGRRTAELHLALSSRGTWPPSRPSR